MYNLHIHSVIQVVYNSVHMLCTVHTSNIHPYTHDIHMFCIAVVYIHMYTLPMYSVHLFLIIYTGVCTGYTHRYIMCTATIYTCYIYSSVYFPVFTVHSVISCNSLGACTKVIQETITIIVIMKSA